jgi:hypothetical protein
MKANKEMCDNVWVSGNFLWVTVTTAEHQSPTISGAVENATIKYVSVAARNYVEDMSVEEFG